MKTPSGSSILPLAFVLAIVVATVALSPLLTTPRPFPDNASDLIEDGFEGKYRAFVKTTPLRNVDGEIEIDMTPATLGTLLDRLNRWDMNDEWMRGHYKWSHQNAPTERVEEELHNVRVRGWLKAVKYEKFDESGEDREGDNDFHLVISNYHYANSKERFFNVEVSGLPELTGDDYDILHTTRTGMGEILDGINLPRGKYYKPTSPIRVEVEGSLYFDGSHYPNTVGPSGMRPKTVWEIHPVTSIRRLN